MPHNWYKNASTNLSAICVVEGGQVRPKRHAIRHNFFSKTSEVKQLRILYVRDQSNATLFSESLYFGANPRYSIDYVIVGMAIC